MKRWHFFLRQPLHGILLLALCAGLWLSSRLPAFRVTHGSLITVGAIVVVSAIIGVLHQLWVLVFWRLELGFSAISRCFGNSGFTIYSIGFVALLTARLASIVTSAALNGGTLAVSLPIRLILAGIIAILNIWGLYSVLRYFGILRAFGLDHFDPSIRKKGLVKGGAYRYTRNVMYLFVLPVFFAPGLLWGSLAATLLGVFHFFTVWIHYYCTELPDMALLYSESE
ncbi:MAG: hypothetical protein JSV89_02385 [Spirochaetaceae bacterium]|nr:MAG: hypothetical protein JSV89_02385 [Spirochaetaceae bacterium]